MVRGLFHGADRIIDAGFEAAVQQTGGHQDVVDAQAPFGIAFKAPAAVVKNASGPRPRRRED